MGNVSAVPGAVMVGNTRPKILLNRLLGRSLPRDHKDSTTAGTHLIVASYTSVTGAEYPNERMHSNVDTNMHSIKVVIVVTSSHSAHSRSTRQISLLSS
jgi:hypothetical protein